MILGRINVEISTPCFRKNTKVGDYLEYPCKDCPDKYYCDKLCVKAEIYRDKYLTNEIKGSDTYNSI